MGKAKLQLFQKKEKLDFLEVLYTTLTSVKKKALKFVNFTTFPVSLWHNVVDFSECHRADDVLSSRFTPLFRQLYCEKSTSYVIGSRARLNPEERINITSRLEGSHLVSLCGFQECENYNT